jgi:hypothetical protein
MQKINYSRLSDEELLQIKFKNLNLKIAGSIIEKRLSRLYTELEDKGLIFKPHTWISDEWFTPDYTPGFAIPFYLFHSRLIKLEKDQMLEAEGYSKKECLEIMRHETGHAISHAYQLYKLKSWENIFGDYRKPYPLWYTPEIRSKEYVTHLNAWYAQAHPLEDFAETFAVWVNPKNNWRRMYSGWGAIRKLEYLDGLMSRIGNRKPLITAAEEYAGIHKLKYTIGQHYERKKRFYSAEWAESFDVELRKIFTDKKVKGGLPAYNFLKRIRRGIRKTISEVLDVPQYTVEQLMIELMKRSLRLDLHLRIPEEEAAKMLLVIVTAQIINLNNSGYYRIPL